MVPSSKLQQKLKNKCQRCFIADMATCATAHCCKLNLCPSCFFHPDHSCGPGPNRFPIRRCLQRCQQRLDFGWGSRCWEVCKRAYDHKGFCDCLQDHRGKSPTHMSESLQIADKVPQCPIATNVMKPTPKCILTVKPPRGSRNQCLLFYWFAGSLFMWLLFGCFCLDDIYLVAGVTSYIL